ncbi:N-acetylgalactosamine kinase isoform X2 [Chrysoperla carnea]|nr:N-acetylgalactosamine kinase isoform X2 [Chrysoperla carnea]
MALDQDIIVAVKIIPDSNTLKINNVDPKYGEHICSLTNFSIDIENEKAPKWYNYFLCGVKGIQDVGGVDFGFGLNVAVTGNIPPGSGLSSSSALVSASVLALAYAKKLNLNKEELANISASCERYIGTQGGGMDQAIAFLASEGCAKLINFSPLRCQDVYLPKGATFIISHSLSELNKAATSDFNCRVMECKLAAKLLAHKKNLEWETVSILKQVQTMLNLSLEKMPGLVNALLHDEPYTKTELCSEFNISNEKFESILSHNTKHLTTFYLKQRSLHVYEEALRVTTFYNLCEQVRLGTANNSDTLVQLGKLMNESHDSLQKLYECSHENLDEIVQISRTVALGSRLTGAGWGGCSVSLVKPEKVDEFIEKLRKCFYEERNVFKLEGLAFVSSPKNGASVFVNT